MSIQNITVALAKAQNEMGNAIKSSDNPYFKSKYADLNAVLAVIKEPLFKNGLCIVQTMEADEHGSYLVTTLMHESGEIIVGKMKLELTKHNMQDLGSAISYARRYSLSALCLLGAEDDDGEKSMERDKPKSQSNLERVTKLAKDKFPTPDEFKVWRTDNGLAEKLSEATDFELIKIESKLQTA